MRIFAVHLLNDFSGSPKVLMQLVKGWVGNGISVTVMTAGGREGFLSDIEGVEYLPYWYRFRNNYVLRFLFLFTSQMHLFLRLLSRARKGDIIYVNTVLPFGAGLLGWMKGSRVIYHVHETSMKPKVLKKFLFGVVRITATDVVYVSRYVASAEPVSGATSHVLYNAIENDFLKTALEKRYYPGEPRNVLMVCSLKAYKGVHEFIRLARMNPRLSFRMVLNARQEEINRELPAGTLPLNLQVFPVQSNVHAFYEWADVVVNLSRPDQWIETFGLTVIEGMAYGLPAIVPPVGGIAELVEDGKNGFHVDSRNVYEVSVRLNELCKPTTYAAFRGNSLNRILRYQEGTFVANSLRIIENSGVGNPFHGMENRH